MRAVCSAWEDAAVPAPAETGAAKSVRGNRGGRPTGPTSACVFSGALLLELFGAPWCIIGVLFAALVSATYCGKRMLT